MKIITLEELAKWACKQPKDRPVHMEVNKAMRINDYEDRCGCLMVEYIRDTEGVVPFYCGDKTIFVKPTVDPTKKRDHEFELDSYIWDLFGCGGSGKAWPTTFGELVKLFYKEYQYAD